MSLGRVEVGGGDRNGDVHQTSWNSHGKTSSGTTVGAPGGENVKLLKGDGLNVTSHTTGGGAEFDQSIHIQAGSQGWSGRPNNISLENGQVFLNGHVAQQGRTALGDRAFLDVHGGNAVVTTYNKDGSVRGQWSSSYQAGGTPTGYYNSTFFGETRGLTGQLGSAIRTGHFDGNDNHFSAGGNGWGHNVGWSHGGHGWGHRGHWDHRGHGWDHRV
jgi:hypothetical protein